MSWDELADWWVEEIRDDPMYRAQVIPLLIELLQPVPGARYLDAGCGEGQVGRALAGTGAIVVGCDLSQSLLALAEPPVVRTRLPDLGWARAGFWDGVFSCLVLDHLNDADAFFRETARIVPAGGSLTVVVNHPIFAAPEADPIIDVSDGEVLWRFGNYLEAGLTRDPAGRSVITFHHRPLGQLLTSAAKTGWRLERMVEQAAGEAAIQATPELAQQRHIPRLLGARWSRSDMAP